LAVQSACSKAETKDELMVVAWAATTVSTTVVRWGVCSAERWAEPMVVWSDFPSVVYSGFQTAGPTVPQWDGL
jgi:hypothetical protein